MLADCHLVKKIGHLAIQRLTEISNAGRKGIHAKARVVLKAYVADDKDNLFKFHPEQLKIELIKLNLNAQLNPESKILWLGTARAVNACRKNFNGKGTYLNCIDSEWSWELNRVFIQAAIKIGYEVKLVEQHSPQIEQAMLSNDSARFIEALAREVKPHNVMTQYSGGNSPTATPQEIMILMDMDCRAKKKYRR